MKKVFPVILALVYCISGHAQDVTFRHLTTDDGLSQISVITLYADEVGFLWIGSRDGLNYYDGNGIRVFKSQKNDPNSLLGNNISKITGNRNGKIYILTTLGLCEYDLKRDRFKTLWENADLTAIHYDKELYVGKGREIYVWDTVKSAFERFYTLPSPQTIVSSLFVSDNGSLYIGTMHDGLFVLGEFGLKKLVSVNSNIPGIYQDSEGDVWAGSWEHGLFLISKGRVVNFMHNPRDGNSISSNFVRTCCEDNLGNIWIGTFNGLDKYDKHTGEFKHYRAGNDPDALTHLSVWSIIKDPQGTVWLGTYFGGVNYFNPEYEIYARYKPSDTEKEGLSFPIVGRMTEDHQGNLWVCTEGGGVNVFDRTTGTFKWYRPGGGPDNISGNNVKAIYLDPRNEVMWFGTHLGGLNKLDPKTNRFTHYRHDRNDSTSLFSDIVRNIVPYGDRLILATDNGACFFSPQTGRCTPLFDDYKTRQLTKNVFDIYLDHRNTLWMSVVGEGVFAYSLETGKLVNYRHDPSDPHSLSNNNINSITQDSNHNLYFCTSGRGLDIYRYDTDDFENYDSGNGLISDCVYNVCEASPDKLLVITNLGFSTFDPETKRFRNYSHRNGFPLSTVNENALYLARDKTIFLGGMQGMVSFREEDLNFTGKPYRIVFSRLFINGTEVGANDRTGLLQNAFGYTPEITLGSSVSTISLEFAVSNFIPANQDPLVYRLEGFSDEWTPVRDRNIITYTNLNPGRYTLVVKSAGPEGAPVAQTTLGIKVLPALYRTQAAFLLYFTVIVAILIYLVKSYKQRVRLRASLEYEQKHLQDTENLNQAKLRFFTNISHEFRTPVTLIISHMEMLLKTQRFTPAKYNRMLKIYNNSLRMKELTDELLDFSKQELGYMKIKASEHNIVDFLYANYLLFEEYARTKGIGLVFDSREEVIAVWYDEKQIQKVINNLISNAFKFTSAGSSIRLGVERDKEEVVITVSDTGIGIPSDELDKIFNRFYQIDDTDPANTGTGIGLALSKGIVELHHGRIEVDSTENRGSEFRVILKSGREHFTADEIATRKTVEMNVEEEKPDPVREAETEEIGDIPRTHERIKGASMLIVEDNEQLKETLYDIFEPFYEVFTASDGAEGLEKVRSRMPDIILSDIVMPAMTGIELCKAIKSDIDTCHIPVVLLTAKASVEHNVEGLRTGADDYIAKPFHVDILISRCNNLVNSRIVLKEKFGKQPSVTPQMLATNALDKEFLDRVTAVIEQHLDDPEFSVDALASATGMSRSKLFTKLKAVTGQSPNEFIVTLRIKKAALLLRNRPELNVSEISVMVGFGSPRYFSKCFKDTYRVRPLEYRDTNS